MMVPEEMLNTMIGGAGVLTPLGTAIAFIWRKIERRIAAIEAELKLCRERERQGQRRSAVHITVIELLWMEVKRRSGRADNDALDRAKKLLDDLKLEMPPENAELTALAHKLDD